MKALRTLLTAGLLVTAVTAFAATKPETYIIVGYYKGAKPSLELYGKATLAVAEKVEGMVQVASLGDDPDHRIEVLFTKDSFKVYVDALPLSNERSTGSAGFAYAVFQGDNVERAESDRSSARH